MKNWYFSMQTSLRYDPHSTSKATQMITWKHLLYLNMEGHTSSFVRKHVVVQYHIRYWGVYGEVSQVWWCYQQCCQVQVFQGHCIHFQLPEWHCVQQLAVQVKKIKWISHVHEDSYQRCINGMTMTASNSGKRLYKLNIHEKDIVTN